MLQMGQYYELEFKKISCIHFEDGRTLKDFAE